VVCTANLARSPLLAALLQDHADRRLGAGEVCVGSAGTEARTGEKAAAGSRSLASRWGLTLDDHRARSIRFVELEDAALIITMTRRQQRIVTRRREGLDTGTFCLRALVAAVEQLSASGKLHAPLATTPRAHVRAVAVAADACRPPMRLRPNLDVPDPIGGTDDEYRAMGDEFSASAHILADALFGPEG
jgi:protein-tyrosine phosphatase